MDGLNFRSLWVVQSLHRLCGITSGVVLASASGIWIPEVAVGFSAML